MGLCMPKNRNPSSRHGMLTHIRDLPLMTFQVHYPASAETGYYSNSRDERYPYATNEQIARRWPRIDPQSREWAMLRDILKPYVAVDSKVRSPKERSRAFPGIARAMAEQWG